MINMDVYQYRPYRHYIFFISFALGCGLFFAFLGCASWLENAYRDILQFALMASLCFVLTKCLFDYLRITVLLCKDGITITTKRKSTSHFVPWENIKHGYIATNIRGHRFLLLSDEPLDKEQTKRLANKASMSTEAWFGDVLAIYIVGTSKESRLLDLILEKSSIVRIEGR